MKNKEKKDVESLVKKKNARKREKWSWKLNRANKWKNKEKKNVKV